ncbi:protoporphyrinogen/coproporphyrinogen oxidase [Aidingimonas lacisalsi]|uniref:protoporphyrinogen/coproporphyrinogen oxidase n=1 Tax=Aidingimonas lacisalsi TaxID=2604086 RepID=UPI0011D182A6|nr:FAD-dependent oxidoreductase [Aidingimonas lacisalsi]
MYDTEFLVVGAGVTGLAFADHIASNDYLICEAANKIGGYCKTIQRDGFTWDYSGHFFHFKHAAIEKDLVSRMGGQKVYKVKKNSKIYWNGGWIDFPFQKNIHQLPKDDFVDCIHGLFFRQKKTPENFQEMLYSKFGKGISERFLIPYNQKLYATDLRNLDMNAMGRFFPHADMEQIVNNFKYSDNGSYNDYFTYPSGGAIQYVNALATGVAHERILLNERVISVDLKNHIALTNRREIRYESLISSAPLPALLGCCKVETNSSLYSWNKVLVFNIGFDSKGPTDIHWIYFPQEEISFYRVGFYDNILAENRMSLYVEIGMNHNSSLGEGDVEKIRDRVIGDLRKVGLVVNHKVLSWHYTVMDPAYVHITERSITEVSRVKEILSNHGVHSIGRYGGWTYCSIEDNIVEAQALAETFNAVDRIY